MVCGAISRSGKCCNRCCKCILLRIANFMYTHNVLIYGSATTSFHTFSYCPQR
jgi:hypothetical protein